MSEGTCPIFLVGRLVATPNALAQITRVDIMAALQRHVVGDWGEVCAADKAQNDRAVVEEARILSAYRAANDKTFWIITEADQSVTTVLLPEDY